MGKKQTTNYFWMSLICFQFRCYHLLFVTPTNDKTKIGNLYLSIFESRSVYAFLYKCFIKDSLIYIRENTISIPRKISNKCSNILLRWSKNELGCGFLIVES